MMGTPGHLGTLRRARWRSTRLKVGDLQAGGPWLDPRDLLVRMTSAGDEGEGVRAATIRTAPRPQALGNHRTRTRTASMVWLVSGALWSLLEMLGYYQPRDSHIHGAPSRQRTTSQRSLHCPDQGYPSEPTTLV